MDSLMIQLIKHMQLSTYGMHVSYADPFPAPSKVIFNNPATIVYWHDGTKTVVKCTEGETFDKEKGFAMALLKRIYGKDYYKIIKKCCEN